MPAYVIVDITVTDPELYEEVKRRTPATVAAFGGTYLSRGGPSECLAGDWNPARLVLLQFESAQHVKNWLASPEYTAIRALRDRSARVNMVVTETPS